MLSVKPQEAGERGDEEEELRRRVAKRQRDYCTESQGPTATMTTTVATTMMMDIGVFENPPPLIDLVVEIV